MALLKDTVTVDVQVHFSGHPVEKPGYKTCQITVNPHHGPVIADIPLACSWDKYRNKWGTPQIGTMALRPLKPNGKHWWSIAEYLHRDANKKSCRRINPKIWDFSDNNMLFGF